MTVKENLSEKSALRTEQSNVVAYIPINKLLFFDSESGKRIKERG